MQIGTIVELTQNYPALGFKKGMRGVCYENYSIGGTPGASFIFENGNFDGFNESEQRFSLKKVGVDPDVTNYKFDNVSKLDRDFKAGVFRRALVNPNSHRKPETLRKNDF